MSDHNPQIDAALKAEHEEDRKAYEALTPEQQKLAGDRARRLFGATHFINNTSYWTLRYGDGGLVKVRDYAAWAFYGIGSALYYAFYGPYIAVYETARVVGTAAGWAAKEAIKGVASAGLAVLRAPFELFSNKSGTNWAARQARRLKARARLARMRVEKGWRATKAFFANLGPNILAGLKSMSKNRIYNPMVRYFNPMNPDGTPKFGSKKENQKWALKAGTRVLIASALTLVGIKVGLGLLHGYVGLGATALLVHGAISLTAKLSTFVVLPVIAAAKRGLKNDPEIRGMAYRYELLKQQKLADYHAYMKKHKYPEFTKIGRKIHDFFQHLKDDSRPVAYEIDTDQPSQPQEKAKPAVEKSTTVTDGKFRRRGYERKNKPVVAADPHPRRKNNQLARALKSFKAAAARGMLGATNEKMAHRLHRVSRLNRPVKTL